MVPWNIGKDKVKERLPLKDGRCWSVVNSKTDLIEFDTDVIGINKILNDNLKFIIFMNGSILINIIYAIITIIKNVNIQQFGLT